MKLMKRIILLLAVSSLLFAGCVSGTNQPTTEEMQTRIANTVVALQTQVASQPTSTPLPTVGLPTFTSVPTLLPTATHIPPTATTTPVFSISKVEDLSGTTGTTLKGGQTFVQTWRLTNGGTEAWSKDYKIIFVSGDNMGITSITIGKVVYPGSTYEVSVTFTAPVKTGSSTANFMMETPNGYKFGLGLIDRPWSIKINIENLFEVTAASVTASANPYSGTCPATITLTPTITVNGSGTVTYYMRIGSGISDPTALVFTASGSANGNSVNWPIDASMTSLSVNVYIDNPNHQDFGTLTIPITCTP
jgi:hypothetical protein